jgi:hypothetical protein
MNTKLLADGWFAIKAGQRQPQKNAPLSSCTAKRLILRRC